MRVLGMVAENFKRIRLVEIAPTGRVVTFSGRPGQGKTSCLDAFLSAVGGKRHTQDMPVRKGARAAKIKLVLGSSKVEWTINRTIQSDGTHSLTLTDASGRPQGRGQGILDELIGDIWMDPTEFARMKPKEQVEILRRVAKVVIECPEHEGPDCARCNSTGYVPLDVERLNQLNAEDFSERTAVGREVRRLEGELAGMVAQDGLPEAVVDVEPIRKLIADAGAANMSVQATIEAKSLLRQKMEGSQSLLDAHRDTIREVEAEIRDLERRLETRCAAWCSAYEAIPKMERDLIDAVGNYEAAPAGAIVDLAPLMADLDHAQLTNREIGKRDQRNAKADELRGKQREYDTLTRAIDDRNEKKRSALASAKMPVDGLTFDEDRVLLRGIPLQQLGESEQIRVCARIAMGENPKLRVLPIMHGESLGAEGMAVLSQMAEEMDFQLLVALVDESGKRGYVIEDGAVAKDNQTA